MCWQIAELEIPLIQKRKDFDTMDDEIDQRVREIELQLAEEMVQSQQALQKLESDAMNTGNIDSVDSN